MIITGTKAVSRFVPENYRGGNLTSILFPRPMAFIVTVYAHSVGHQWIECDDFALAISNNLRIGISVKKQVRHQGLPEDKGCHFRIWFIVYQVIQRMLDSLFLADGVGVLINMNRQASNRLGKNSDARVDGSHLHGTSLIHRFTGITVVLEYK